ATEFLGYDTELAEGVVLAIVCGAESVNSLKAGESGWVVVNQTPFYGESGGQVGDHGFLRILDQHDQGGVVTDTQRFAGGAIFGHYYKAEAGALNVGDAVQLEVNHERRSAIRANHSGTHLLHEALRQALGEHVAQRGSLNAPDRLRFDFSHNKALSQDELKSVETSVNNYIRQNTSVETRIMTPDEARGIGAQALFGEKYGDEVRVVSMGHADTGKGANGNTYSIELCGGTHVERTGDIGVFVVLGDSASAAGVRRIEALTGEAAFQYLIDQDQRLAAVANALKAKPADVVDRVKALQDERKALTAEIADLRRQVAMGGGGSESHAETVNDISIIAQVVSGVTGKDLPGLIDEHKSRLGSGVVVLIADAGGKAAVAAGVTSDLVERVSAIDLVRATVAELGGKGGGGRPDMAQGGGASVENADAAIAAAKKLLEG
ncbi:MAG: alanine--tRNA ligase, partial [Boseongicola sp.]|nr:alanine--tRNA ligase [Boseongicola sp.]